MAAYKVEICGVNTATLPILSEEETGIMEESALAAFVMRKNLEASKTNDTENDVSKYFGDIVSNTIQ